MGAFRLSLQVVGLTGALIFAAALIASFIHPVLVEQLAVRAISAEVEQQVGATIRTLDTGMLVGKAAKLGDRYAAEAQALQQQLAEQLPRRLAAEIAQLQNLDCECRKRVEGSIRFGFETRLADATAAQQRINALIRLKYMDTAAKLTREFRIFTGTNALVLALLALAAWVKPKAGLHLVPPAIVLSVAAVVTAYVYLFEQNWWNTIIFSNYVGFWYVGYLSIGFAFLADIVFNHGHVTGTILNAIFEGIGSALSVAPC